MNYRAGVTYRIRMPMRDGVNNLVPGLAGTLSAIVILPNGTPDPTPPVIFSEVAPGLYEFVYAFGAGVGTYSFILNDPLAVASVLVENVLANDFDTVVNEIRILRIGNMQVEFVITTSQIINRRVEVGRVDYEEVKLKADVAPDWSSPVSTSRKYWWYRELGDWHPYRVGPQT